MLNSHLIEVGGSFGEKELDERKKPPMRSRRRSKTFAQWCASCRAGVFFFFAGNREKLEKGCLKPDDAVKYLTASVFASNLSPLSLFVSLSSSLYISPLSLHPRSLSMSLSVCFSTPYRSHPTFQQS